MISSTPSLFGWSLANRQLAGIEPFVEQYARDVTFYGSGKTALRDGMAALADSNGNVLVPAYLPDAVVEPFHELGLESRYYRIQPTLAPDLADLERRIDDETIAVMSVNYFGFPQPGLAEFMALIEEYECYHIDDNAHAPLSVDGGTLLGTRGDLGITSLWKLLPIPNGAMLYCNTDDAIEQFEPSSLAGVRDQFGASDAQFIVKSAIRETLNTNARLRQSVDAFLTSRQSESAVASPADRYQAGREPMSRLSAHVVDGTDPEAIRAARRTNYRAWHRELAPRTDLEILWDSLPDGICPQVFPVRASNPQRFLAELERAGVHGAHSWPRLSETVRTNPAYETATTLAQEIIALPVQQHIDPSSIAGVGDRLRC